VAAASSGLSAFNIGVQRWAFPFPVLRSLFSGFSGLSSDFD
jgi:hypothetical protein